MSRSVLAFALSAAAAVAAVSPAQAQPAAYSDAELGQYAQAVEKVSELNRALNGAQPTDAQRQQMVDAITATGLTVEKFNAISAAAGASQMLRARIAIASTPASAAGSVGASVTDAETDSYVKAMAGIQAVNASTPPTAEQTAAQQKAVTDSGLTIERFNAISTAAAGDKHLRARLSLAQAKLAG